MNTLLDRFVFQVNQKKQVILTEPIYDSLNFISVEKLTDYITWFTKTNSNGIFNLGSQGNVSLIEIASNVANLINDSSVKIVNGGPAREPRHVYRVCLNKISKESGLNNEENIDFVEIQKNRGLNFA